MGPDEDAVFRALGDHTRRSVLDALRQRNGQTLNELCGNAEMTRQSLTQHLDILEAANLIATVRQGREKLHYINVVPIHELNARWIQKFEVPRLQSLRAIKQKAEAHMTNRPSYVYVTYINSSPEAVWNALTDADVSAQYWAHRNVSDWQPGSKWEHQRCDGSDIVDVIGNVVESSPPRRLVLSWTYPGATEAPSTVAFDIEEWESLIRLTVTHTDLSGDGEMHRVSSVWPAVLANLKSLLETGAVLHQAPWRMPTSRGESSRC